MYGQFYRTCKFLLAIVSLWSETHITAATEQIDSGLQSAQMLYLDAIEP